MSESMRESSERLSALVDGQLHGQALAQTLAYFASTPQAQDTWDTYHLIGDAMRSSGASVRPHDPAFVKRLRAELAQQNIEKRAASPLCVTAQGQKDLKMAAANDPWFRRVVGLASVALLAVLAWQGVALMGPASGNGDGAEQWAKTSTPMAPVVAPSRLVAADGSPVLIIRDPQLDALLAAHRQMGGATALQMPSGFMRSATFNESER